MKNDYLKNQYDFETRGISQKEWFGILAWVVMGVASSIIFSYSTFQTRRETETIDKRLDRIENKLDQVIDARAGNKK